MFDFPQPGEIYRSAGFPDVAVRHLHINAVFRGKCRTAARTLSGTRTACNSVSLCVSSLTGAPQTSRWGVFCGNLPVTVLTCLNAAPNGLPKEMAGDPE